ncbi:L-serine ammonia-lyase, iron-sulfur-dependent, subunit beta, partial [bacterium]|nr:L-serine ammonia-lyase, iron-sulfur-dependent, subunit beta [bacterium]
MKKTYRIFDIIGPRMIGPSSSHTAGAAKIGLVANRLVHGAIRRAQITLYESFATTGRGHGTDRAIIGGLLGFA